MEMRKKSAGGKLRKQKSMNLMGIYILDCHLMKLRSFALPEIFKTGLNTRLKNKFTLQFVCVPVENSQ